jgi:hypothetical protein
MKITKLDKTSETVIGFKEVLSVIENNRTRVRNLCNIVMTSCSLFLSSSFVVLFFLIKEPYKNITLIIAILLLSNVMLIVAILFTVLSAYIREPKVITTEFALISIQTYYLHKEQKNSRVAIIFLFGGIITFLVGLIFFAIRVVK